MKEKSGKNTQELDQKKVEALVFEGKRKKVFGSKPIGFGVLVNRFSKSYFVYARARSRHDGSGEKVMINIGPTNKLTFDIAQLEAEKYILALHSGKNPVEVAKKEHEEERRLAAEKLAKEEAARKQAEEDAKKDLTIGVVFEAMIKDKVESHKKENTIKDYQKIFKNYFSDWTDKQLRTLSKTDVRERHRHIEKTVLKRRSSSRPEYKGQVAANKAMRVLRVIYNFGKDEMEIPLPPVNPFVALKSRWNKETPRTRLIGEADFPLWFDILERIASGEDPEGNPIQANAILFMLFTGCRREEALKLKRSDINLRNRVLVLRDTKTGTDCQLPITNTLKEIIERQKILSHGKTYLFSTDRKMDDRITDVNGTVILITKRLSEKEIAIRWSCHDLRRMYAVAADRLVTRREAMLLTNHADRSIHGNYIPLDPDALRIPASRIEAEILRRAGRAVGNIFAMHG